MVLVVDGVVVGSIGDGSVVDSGDRPVALWGKKDAIFLAEFSVLGATPLVKSEKGSVLAIEVLATEGGGDWKGAVVGKEGENDTDERESEESGEAISLIISVLCKVSSSLDFLSSSCDCEWLTSSAGSSGKNEMSS